MQCGTVCAEWGTVNNPIDYSMAHSCWKWGRSWGHQGIEVDSPRLSWGGKWGHSRSLLPVEPPWRLHVHSRTRGRKVGSLQEGGTDWAHAHSEIDNSKKPKRTFLICKSIVRLVGAMTHTCPANPHSSFTRHILFHVRSFGGGCQFNNTRNPTMCASRTLLCSTLTLQTLGEDVTSTDASTTVTWLQGIGWVLYFVHTSIKWLHVEGVLFQILLNRLWSTYACFIDLGCILHQFLTTNPVICCAVCVCVYVCVCMLQSSTQWLTSCYCANSCSINWQYTLSIFTMS